MCVAAAMACAVEPYGPVPTKAQVEWQKMEMNMFVHFGPNTFSGLEWGTGMEAEDLFRPTELDCRQWARTAKAAGMKGIIITAKHHDGFCLWPNPMSQHSVKDMDVLKELSDACREEGIKFGVYISPWDRNDPAYGTPEYNVKYVETLRSVCDGTYGPIFEQWFDGACGEGPNGKRQEYDWDLFHGTVSALQPDAIQFSNTGPGCRWVGNERGEAPETNWSTIDSAWIPVEADVSIRPGWFWRSSEDERLKSVDELMDIWYSSVGRNALLLLNVPADTRGKIPEVDSLRLMEFKARRDSVFARNLAASVNGPGKKLIDGNYDSYVVLNKPSIIINLPENKPFNLIVLQEYIPLGQRISSFKVEARIEDNWQEIASGTTVGYKRILRVPETNAGQIRITVTDALATPILSEVSVY